MNEAPKPPDALFGNRGESAKILDLAKTRLAENKTMSTQQLEKAQQALVERAAQDHQQEAAAFAEEIVAWLNDAWNSREFTVEQRVFSLALSTINFRQHFPEERGGKEYFDKVAHEAHLYFKKATNQ